MIPWFKNVKPHKDIQDGHLDESIFAANLSEVASGKGREIYTNPEMFFQKTFFTSGLKNIAKRAIKGLNGGQDSDNRIVSLQTGFGGGKTHTLISLYHIAKLGKKANESEFTKQLLDEIGKPKFDSANVAVFTNNTNDPIQGRKVKGTRIRTIWGEIAYQLGGMEGYNLIKENDEKLVAPKGLFKKILEEYNPSLILIDELADYCVSAANVKVEKGSLMDQTISFLQELTSAVSETDNTILICTLPASKLEITASDLGEQILTALENRLDRYGAKQKPVEEEEVFEVVKRRLFEDLGDIKETEKVISEYSEMYHSLFAEIPEHAIKSEYKDKLRRAYPFHPELIDIFRLKWASNPYFQRTRGVLRILGSIISDLWKRQNSLTGNNSLIHTSDVSFSNVEALSSQITTLFGAGYDAVIQADISGTSSNAFYIDNEVKALGKYNITQGIASTILLGTFGTQGQNKGISLPELKLYTIKPGSFNHNDINGALDRFEDKAHYLYYSSSAHKRYWFHTKPNINILINQAKNDINNSDIESEILKRITERIKSINLFNVIVNPSEDIPEQQKPTLLILSPKYLLNQSDINEKTKRVIEKIATKKGKSERIYRNTILFLACSEIGISKLNADIRDYLGCQKINQEYASQLEKEQKSDVKQRIDDASKQTDNSIAVAYSQVLKHTGSDGIRVHQLKQFKSNIDEQINSYLINELKNEEWILEAVGLNFLKKNNLTPTIEKPIKVKYVYEAFLRFDDKPMITGIKAIQDSLLKYCHNGEFCIATGDGKNFTRYFLKESVPYFDVSDETYWLADKSLKPKQDSEREDDSNQTIGDKLNPSSYKTEDETNTESGSAKKLRSLTISGKVKLEDYSELFQCFIAPFSSIGNKIEIEMKFKIKSSENSQIDESMKQYKDAKESAKQLGLRFEEE